LTKCPIACPKVVPLIPGLAAIQDHLSRGAPHLSCQGGPGAAPDGGKPASPAPVLYSAITLGWSGVPGGFDRTDALPLGQRQ